MIKRLAACLIVLLAAGIACAAPAPRPKAPKASAALAGPWRVRHCSGHVLLAELRSCGAARVVYRGDVTEGRWCVEDGRLCLEAWRSVGDGARAGWSLAPKLSRCGTRAEDEWVVMEKIR